MLLGREAPDLKTIEDLAVGVESDLLLNEAYREGDPSTVESARVPVDHQGLIEVLARSAVHQGGPVRIVLTSGTARVTCEGSQPIVVSTSADALADDPVIAPLSLLDPTTRALADAYAVGEGRTPLVIGTCAEGGHRVSVAWWVGADNTVPVEDLDTLTDLVNSWDGRSANAERWINALTETRAAATEIVMAGVARRINSAGKDGDGAAAPPAADFSRS